MDVLEKLNRTFGTWYEGLFGGGAAEDADLRPRDILRRILRAMEDGRREGLDGQVYVPNHFTLDIAVSNDDERDYLRTFLDAEELAAAVRQRIEQHGYKTRGGLAFEINELDGKPDGGGRVSVRCRFDATISEQRAAAERPRRRAAVVAAPDRAPAVAGDHDDDDAGTVPVSGALAFVTVHHANAPDEVVPLTSRGAQIGRSRQAGNDVVIANDGQVSKRHARIERALAGGGWFVRDLDSTNGTYVNEQPVSPSDLYPLGASDEIRIGATRLTLSQTAGGKPAMPPPPPRAVAVAPRLVGESGMVFPLASEMIVGRALTSDIMLPDDGVAARHARLTLDEAGQVFVEDLDTTGGTFVNGERIPGRFAVVLYAGDRVRFGRAEELRLDVPGARGRAASAAASP